MIVSSYDRNLLRTVSGSSLFKERALQTMNKYANLEKAKIIK